MTNKGSRRAIADQCIVLDGERQAAAEKRRMADALTMRPTRLQSCAYGASQSGVDCPNPQ
jgi:predicted Zn-ribbon and HTH transcriptional regulator